MDKAPAGARPISSIRLRLARIGALCFSLGIAGTLMVYAGGGLGCGSPTDTDVIAGPEKQPSATPRPATTTGEEGFMGGSKAWGGQGLRKSTPTVAAPAASASAAPKFFGGSKSGAFIEEPQPTPNPPPSQK